METEDSTSNPSSPDNSETQRDEVSKSKHDQAANDHFSFLNYVKSFGVEPWDIEDGTAGINTCLLPTYRISLARKIGAEFIGTLILVFSCTATAIVDDKSGGTITPFGLATSTGISVMIMNLSTSHVSGAHLNPAVTIGFASLKYFPWKHVPFYIVAQMVASVCAAFSAKAMFNPIMGGGVTIPSGGVGEAFAMEFIIGFILMFVIAAVAIDNRAVKELTGIVIGATVTVNVLIAGKTSGASMNPARTLGPAMAANNYKAIWVYFTAPVLGSLAGAAVYSTIRLPENVDKVENRVLYQVS